MWYLKSKHCNRDASKRATMIMMTETCILHFTFFTFCTCVWECVCECEWVRARIYECLRGNAHKLVDISIWLGFWRIPINYSLLGKYWISDKIGICDVLPMGKWQWINTNHTCEIHLTFCKHEEIAIGWAENRLCLLLYKCGIVRTISNGPSEMECLSSLAPISFKWRDQLIDII